MVCSFLRVSRHTNVIFLKFPLSCDQIHGKYLWQLTSLFWNSALSVSVRLLSNMKQSFATAWHVIAFSPIALCKWRKILQKLDLSSQKNVSLHAFPNWTPVGAHEICSRLIIRKIKIASWKSLRHTTQNKFLNYCQTVSSEKHSTG